MQRRRLTIASALSLGSLSAGTVALGLRPGSARAQSSWPTRPLRMVIGYPPGGSTDVAGRLLAEDMTRRLGQQVVVDNRAGAGGTVGAMQVVRAESDGYTILQGASAEVSIAPITVKALQYDPLVDLQPIVLVGRVPFFLAVNPNVPARTLKEFIAYARANPNKLNYSSFGNNTSNHLAGELFKSLTGIQATHVPYKGSGPSISDLIGGQVQYTFDTPPAVLGHIRSGRLRALAVAGTKRQAGAPDVPTFAEAGLTGFDGGTWFGLLAPAKTPKPIIDRINAAANAGLSSASLRQAFEAKGIVPAGGTPEQFTSYIRAEIDKWKKLAARIGIVAE